MRKKEGVWLEIICMSLQITYDACHLVHLVRANLPAKIFVHVYVWFDLKIIRAGVVGYLNVFLEFELVANSWTRWTSSRKLRRFWTLLLLYSPCNNSNVVWWPFYMLRDLRVVQSEAPVMYYIYKGAGELFYSLWYFTKVCTLDPTSK